MSEKNEINTEKETCKAEQIADEKLGKVTGGKSDKNGVIPIIFASTANTLTPNGNNDPEAPGQ